MPFICTMGRHPNSIAYKEVSRTFDFRRAYMILPKCHLLILHHLRGWSHQPRPTPCIHISNYNNVYSPDIAWTCLFYAQWVVTRALLRVKKCLVNLILDKHIWSFANVLSLSCIILGVDHANHVQNHAFDMHNRPSTKFFCVLRGVRTIHAQQAHTILSKCHVMILHHLRGWLHQPHPLPLAAISTKIVFAPRTNLEHAFHTHNRLSPKLYCV